MCKIWSNSEINYLINNYSNVPISNIQNDLSRSYSSILNKARKLNLVQNKEIAYKTRTFTCNEQFFEKPNLLNSYWAGFIGADGCITDLTRLSIHISSFDRILLDRFKKDINFDGNINIQKPRPPIKETVKLTLTSKKIINDLQSNFNIIPCKSLLLQPPKIDGLNALAYIIGNIDGDGTIRRSNDKYKYLRIKFNGTYNLLIWIKQILLNIVNFNSNVNTYSSISELVIIGKYAEKIGLELKNINIPKLERKWCNI